MHRLGGIVQQYAWGSPTAIPELVGRLPTGDPEAELWMGAHPSAPSLVETESGAVPLNAYIAADPAGTLGPGLQTDFGEQLPFLLKVLAAAEPLSLQAHPSPEQALCGFARENAAGIPLDAPHRSYRDPFHKPELVCAVTPFTALCGFRPVKASIELLDGLGVAGLAPVVDRLASGDANGLLDALGLLLRAPVSESTLLAEHVAAACGANAGPAEFAPERAWAVSLAEKYPGDPGVVTALLLNLVELAPGEALFLGAGNLHAYLGGLAVEIMAASDNVLRGGLTPKFIDVEELLSVVDPTPFPVSVQRPQAIDGITTYEAPVTEFGLQHVAVDGPRRLSVSGPEIVLCTAGKVGLRSESAAGSADLWLDCGESAFIPHHTGVYGAMGDGAVYRAVAGTPIP